MRPSSYPIEDLVPHRPPMILIDEIVSVDESSLVAAVDVRPEWKGNWVAIEYMAQAAAALVGTFDRRTGVAHPARPGFLLGTRRLTLRIPEFEVGKRYYVRVRNEFADESAASFSCEMTDGDRVVATAILNAYRPTDVTAFLAEQRRG